MGGPVTSLGNNAAGARVGAVRGDNGVPPPGRRPGEGVRGDNRVPPPHPIHIQRQKQGKAPPCVFIKVIRCWYYKGVSVEMYGPLGPDNK